MKAYNQGITKTEFVNEMKLHAKHDDFIKGSYFKDGKGCAVGCGIMSIGKLKSLKFTDYNQHKLLETHLGIPEWLARVQDTLFEGMSPAKAKTWPVKFAQAINSGADLEAIRPKFLCVVLKHSLVSMSKAKYDEATWPQVKAAVDQCKAAVKQMIKAQKSGDQVAIDSARSAACSARSAADSACSARSAACSARSAACSARSAADSAADSAYSACSARSAADSAADSAYSACSARSAADSARSAAYDYYAAELLKLLKDQKV